MVRFKTLEQIKMLASEPKKISQKYKKMRSKRPPLPFNFSQIVDADSVVYDNDTTLQDVASRKGAPIAAKKISQKY